MDNYKTGETPEKLSNAIYRHQKLVPGQSTTLHSLQRSRFKSSLTGWDVANMYTVTYEYPVCEHNPIISWYTSTNVQAASTNSALGGVHTRWPGTVYE